MVFRVGFGTASGGRKLYTAKLLSIRGCEGGQACWCFWSDRRGCRARARRRGRGDRHRSKRAPTATAARHPGPRYDPDTGMPGPEDIRNPGIFWALRGCATRSCLDVGHFLYVPFTKKQKVRAFVDQRMLSQSTCDGHMLYCTPLYTLVCTLYNTILYDTILHGTVLCYITRHRY